MYGARGRIGLITLATDTGVLPEIQRVLPDGVQAYPAPITLPRGEVTPRALAEMLESDELEEAAHRLAWTGVQGLLFACTTGSLVHGPGWDRALIERIERAAGIPTTTTTTAVLSALRTVGATRLAIATPYIDELNAIELRFFEESGFEVAAIAGLQCATDQEIGLLSPGDAVDLIASIDAPTADAIFISCTNFHVLEAIEQIEIAYGKPVVTSNQAGAWAMLRMIGIEDAISGSGRLLTLPLSPEERASA
jgi:maleate isomerase